MRQLPDVYIHCDNGDVVKYSIESYEDPIDLFLKVETVDEEDPTKTVEDSITLLPWTSAEEPRKDVKFSYYLVPIEDVKAFLLYPN
jgi:hypothetical protein